MLQSYLSYTTDCFGGARNFDSQLSLFVIIKNIYKSKHKGNKIFILEQVLNQLGLDPLSVGTCCTTVHSDILVATL